MLQARVERLEAMVLSGKLQTNGLDFQHYINIIASSVDQIKEMKTPQTITVSGHVLNIIPVKDSGGYYYSVLFVNKHISIIIKKTEIDCNDFLNNKTLEQNNTYPSLLSLFPKD